MDNGASLCGQTGVVPTLVLATSVCKVILFLRIYEVLQPYFGGGQLLGALTLSKALSI